MCVCVCVCVSERLSGWGRDESIYSGIEQSLGFVMITLSTLPALNSSSVTFCLGWGLVCQRVFLSDLAPPSALGFLCALDPECLSILLALPRDRLLLLYLLEGLRGDREVALLSWPSLSLRG